jgi:hypothetical protein
VSAVHAAEQRPATQRGAVDGHCASVVQLWPTGFGTHAPLLHVDPLGQVVVEQSGTHWPSAQTSPVGHSLLKRQAFVAAVHDPSTHTWPALQSAFDVQAHGSVVPQVGPASGGVTGASVPASVGVPFGTQLDATQESPVGQSAFVVQPIGVGGFVPGATQSPPLQTAPWGHWSFEAHDCSHPAVVQTDPLGQSEDPVQDFVPGALTLLQEKPSHW